MLRRTGLGYILGFCLFPLADSTAAAAAGDAASPGGKVEKKHLKLAELANVQLCAFLGVERDMMRITCESSAVITEKNQQEDILVSAVGQCGPGPGILVLSLDSGTGQVIDLSSS